MHNTSVLAIFRHWNLASYDSPKHCLNLENHVFGIGIIHQVTPVNSDSGNESCSMPCRRLNSSFLCRTKEESRSSNDMNCVQFRPFSGNIIAPCVTGILHYWEAQEMVCLFCVYRTCHQRKDGVHRHHARIDRTGGIFT